MQANLEPSKVLSILSKTLPDDCESFGSPHVALAALIHALHISLHFRLHPSHAVPDNVTDDEEKRLAASRLPNNWSGPGRDLSLAYKHASSAMTWETCVSKVGNRAIVNAVAVEVSQIYGSRVPCKLTSGDCR